MKNLHCNVLKLAHFISSRVVELKTDSNYNKTSLFHVTKEGISKDSLLKNLPFPLFTKEGCYSSLWQREVKRDFPGLMLVDRK